MTNAQVAAELDRTPAEMRRFWLALGFPDARTGVRYSRADLEAARVWSESLRSAGLDVAAGIRLVRALGQSVERIAEWQVAAIADRHASVTVTPALEQVLVHAWRRHLASAWTRAETQALRVATTPSDPAQEPPAVMTVGFADLVAFSALSNELDVSRLGDLVEIFESRSADVVAAHDGQIIKTLGDSVLFTSASAPGAFAIGQGLIELIGGDARLPDVKIGLATGEVITRLGDVFGPPVNLAARLTALARRNRMIVDAATQALLDPAEVHSHPLSAREMRGFGLVEPIAVRRR